MDSYAATRDRLEGYFDREAAKVWERLTSDAPVGRIRQTVRQGRDRMRAILLDALPQDLTGARVLDAGAGTGAASAILAERGARVVAVDISPKLLDVARDRLPGHLRGSVDFRAGDMADPALGRFDHVIAMDSLIHYRAPDIARTLDALAGRTDGSIVFTVAPRTALLTMMHNVGQFFPRGSRSPAIVPVTPSALDAALSPMTRALGWSLCELPRVASGFYISQAMELSR
jgi:magnesium-protoporphyrin O-methyltransferase